LQLRDGVVDVDAVPVNRCLEAVEPGWLEHDTCGQRVSLFRLYSGVATGQRCCGYQVVVVPWVANVDTTAGLVITFTQRCCTYVARAGGTRTPLVVDGPVQADFPGPDITGTFVVGPTGSQGGFKGFNQRNVVQERNVEFSESLFHVVAAAQRAQRAEEYGGGVRVTQVTGWYETQTRDTARLTFRDYAAEAGRHEAEVFKQSAVNQSWVFVGWIKRTLIELFVAVRSTECSVDRASPTFHQLASQYDLEHFLFGPLTSGLVVAVHDVVGRGLA